MPMETFKVIYPGPLTTVQDLGRYGYQQYGMSPSGALDEYSLRVGNILVGNRENAASLEITLFGCQLRALRNTAIAITGADMAPARNGQPVVMWQSVTIGEGDIISFPRLVSGCRAYLAVAGGIDVPMVMGSASTYLKAAIGGLDGRALKKADILRAGKPVHTYAGARVPADLIPTYNQQIELRVMLGPQDECFTREGIKTFLNSEYEVSVQADRMGYRLEGLPIQHRSGADIISDGIPPGAVQVPGDGLPIILLADRQTVGGYTKIATVISADIPGIAQTKPGDKVGFKAVGEADACAARQEHERRIELVKSALL
jgi:antagonist of KipI